METLAKKLNTDELKRALNEKFCNDFLKTKKNQERKLIEWINSECYYADLLYDFFYTDSDSNLYEPVYEVAKRISKGGREKIDDYFDYEQEQKFYSDFSYLCADFAEEYEKTTKHKININFTNLDVIINILAENVLYNSCVKLKKSIDLFLKNNTKYYEFAELIKHLESDNLESIENPDFSMQNLNDFLKIA